MLFVVIEVHDGSNTRQALGPFDTREAAIEYADQLYLTRPPYARFNVVPLRKRWGDSD